MFTNILHDSPYYCSASAAYVHNGIMYSAHVINPPGGISTQYTVVVRTNLATDEKQEIKRYTAADSQRFALSQGANPELSNGKHGNVGIALDTSTMTLYLVLEVRMNSVNKPKWVRVGIVE